MHRLILLLAIVTVSAQAQAPQVGSGERLGLEEYSAGTVVSSLEGIPVLLGATVASASYLLLAAAVDSATFTIVGYPVAAATGAYFGGRLVGADGSYLGALIGGAAGVVPGAIILLVDEGSNEALINVSLSGLIIYLVGAPIGAAIGYQLIPNFLVGPTGELAEGVSLRIRF